MTITRIFILPIVLIVSGTLNTTPVFAELFVSNPWDSPPAFKIVMGYVYRWGNGSTSSSIYNERDGNQVTEMESGKLMRLFCADFFTSTSKDFVNGTGQVYHSSSLADSSFFSDLKKTQIQSLYDHVYTKAFHDDYSVNDPFYASLFQFALWEITNDPVNNLSLRDGDLWLGSVAPLGADGTYVFDPALRILALDTLDSWFNAILNDSWDTIGYAKDTVNLTVYLAEGGTRVSQTLIGAEHTSSVPEPATMLLWTLGSLGVMGYSTALKRSRMKNQAM